MAREEHKDICTQGGDMLAYLYGEMSVEQRDMFDIHLANCSTCIDSFAELSQSRYSVYEWKKLDFDPLMTPEIVIPYREVVEVSPSFGDRIRLMFAQIGWTAAVPSFGAILIAVMVGYFWLGNDRPDNTVIAQNGPSSSVTPIPQPKASVPVSVPSPVFSTDDTVIGSTKPANGDKITPVRASERATDKRTNQRAPTTKSAPKPQPRRASMPTLADHDDDEDDTLRLSDLFDDIDTSR